MKDAWLYILVAGFLLVGAALMTSIQADYFYKFAIVLVHMTAGALIAYIVRSRRA